MSLVVGTEACAGFRPNTEPVEQEETARMGLSIEAAQEKLTDRVMSLPGVVGTAIGECEGEPCIKVLVARTTEELVREIPSTFEGLPVVIQETGEIHARPLDSP
ncbi:hypothetical protein MYX65_05410 [Acidobacteria bacterium AH-259-L09]|nr:hypothetical protein [Acidobacteria bacterium AH-259-L09]